MTQTELSLPAVADTDNEEVALALQTAHALWKRADHHEAVRWLRRAAATAGECGDDVRSVVLAARAADLTSELGIPRSIPPPAPATNGSGDVNGSSAGSNGAHVAAVAPLQAALPENLQGPISVPPGSSPYSAEPGTTDTSETTLVGDGFLHGEGPDSVRGAAQASPPAPPVAPSFNQPAPVEAAPVQAIAQAAPVPAHLIAPAPVVQGGPPPPPAFVPPAPAVVLASAVQAVPAQAPLAAQPPVPPAPAVAAMPPFVAMPPQMAPAVPAAQQAPPAATMPAQLAPAGSVPMMAAPAAPVLAAAAPMQVAPTPNPVQLAPPVVAPYEPATHQALRVVVVPSGHDVRVLTARILGVGEAPPPNAFEALLVSLRPGERLV